MREIRTYGSEGGAAGFTTGCSYPYHLLRRFQNASNGAFHTDPSLRWRSFQDDKVGTFAEGLDGGVS